MAGEEMTGEEKVVIRGQVFLYREKAPFVTSGESVFGALELNIEEDKIRCHECGEWLKRISGKHLSNKHQLTAREYKHRHGLRLSTALVNEKMRVILSTVMSRLNDARGGSPAPLKDPEFRKNIRPMVGELAGRRNHQEAFAEQANEKNRCHAQILHRIQRLAGALGHTPTDAELRVNGLSPNTILKKFNLTAVSALMSLAGLPAAFDGRGRRVKYSRGVLVEMLRDFLVEHGRIPFATDFKRGLLPSAECFKREFVTMQAAFIEAGLALHYRGRGRPRKVA